MRVIIAGSRSITSYALLENVMEDAMRSDWEIGEIVSGGARGVDSMGEQWAKKHGIPVRRFPARWERDGRGAGMMRNLEMAVYADGLVALWDGGSRGTKHMVGVMERMEKPTVVWREGKETK